MGRGNQRTLASTVHVGEELAIREGDLDDSSGGSPVRPLLFVRTDVLRQNLRGDLNFALSFIRSLADPMLEAPVAFVAHPLDHFRIGRQFGADGDGPRLYVGTVTRERPLGLEVAEVAAAVTFGHAQAFRVRMAIGIEPRAIVEAEAFHDKG